MNIASPRGKATIRSRQTAISLAAGLAFAFASSAFAQEAATLNVPVLLAENVLPDSPGTVRTESIESAAAKSSSSLNAFDPGGGAPAAPAGRIATRRDKVIDPDESAQTLRFKDKVIIGTRDAVSPYNAAGWLLASGYEQALNGSPNYGTNAKAFGQRFGAAAARGISESVFSDAVMANILREDPRYYRLGPQTNFLKRTVYAVTRPFITRTDSGRTTPNFALLAGNLGGAYLTKTYYPELNQSNDEVLKTFGGSLGGSALGFVVSEFFGDAFKILRHTD